MKTWKLLLILFIVLVTGDWIIPSGCFAQQPVKLQDVARIEMAVYQGSLLGTYQLMEVIPDTAGTWHSYETGSKILIDRIHKSESHKRILLKTITADTIEQLLALINRCDTVIRPGLFNITPQGLKNNINTQFILLRANQKPEFIEALHSKKIAEQALFYELLHPLLLTGATHSIKIITKDGRTVSAIAEGFFSIYELPWLIGLNKCYDPGIAKIFYALRGDNWYTTTSSKSLSGRIAIRIYYQHFKERFNFDNLKTDYPSIAANLNKSFYPKYLYISKTTADGAFYSKRLPKYISVGFNFDLADTAAAGTLNRYQDSLVTTFSKADFITRYLKKHAGTGMTVYPYYAGLGLQDKPRIFEALKQHYPAMAAFNYKQALYIALMGNGSVSSWWLLLPDHTLILYRYHMIRYPETDMDNSINFMGIKNVLDQFQFDHSDHYRDVCVVISPSGQIHHYGIVEPLLINNLRSK